MHRRLPLRSFATGSSHQRVRPCPPRPESGSNVRVLVYAAVIPDVPLASFMRSPCVTTQRSLVSDRVTDQFCAARNIKVCVAASAKAPNLNGYQATCPSIPGHTSFTVMTSVNAWSCRLVSQKSSNTSNTCRYRPVTECLTQVVDQAPCQG